MSNQQAKIIEIITNLLGLSAEDATKLGLFILTNKESLIAKLTKLDWAGKTDEKIWNEIFEGSPVIPDYKTVLDNIIEQLAVILEKVAVVVHDWLGDKAAETFRNQVAKILVTAKGETTHDWKRFGENIKTKVEEIQKTFDKLKSEASTDDSQTKTKATKQPANDEDRFSFVCGW